MMKLNQISTKEISDQLSNREGVETIYIPPHQEVKIISHGTIKEIVEGPATILINID
jgi:phosphopantetheine adenylyltransferase